MTATNWYALVQPEYLSVSVWACVCGYVCSGLLGPFSYICKPTSIYIHVGRQKKKCVKHSHWRWRLLNTLSSKKYVSSNIYLELIWYHGNCDSHRSRSLRSSSIDVALWVDSSSLPKRRRIWAAAAYTIYCYYMYTVASGYSDSAYSVRMLIATNILVPTQTLR